MFFDGEGVGSFPSPTELCFTVCTANNDCENWFLCVDLPVFEDETPTALEQKGTEEEGGITDEKQTAESALEEELSSVDVGDTSSFLETLDSEVSMMVSAG